VSRRATIAAVIAVVVALVGTVGLGLGFEWGSGGAKSAPAAAAPAGPQTTSTSVFVAPTTPPAAFLAGAAKVASVDLFDFPNPDAPFVSLPNPTIEHVPLYFLVKQRGPDGWLLVQYNQRPNGATAWVRQSDVDLVPVSNRIVVEREAKRLTVYRGTSTDVLYQAPVAVGTARTPTPLGDFYVDIVVALTHATGPYGPYQMSVAGFSDVLQSFGGGPGQIAIHGTDHPELIGQDVSNGCVRMTNDDISALVPLAPPGTPVQIVA
jgi:lipoprotein-anchoring transpeptidase ErfK/SrfK